jgi:hypothetical protein
MQPILLFIGVDEYWFRYFEHESKTNALTSSFYWFTLGAILLNTRFKAMAVELIDFIYVQASIFALVAATLTGMSIFLKMAMPFIVLNMMASVYILVSLIWWEMKGLKAILTIAMWAVLGGYSIMKYA